MSRNSTTVGSSPSARDTAALITNNARTSAHVVDVRSILPRRSSVRGLTQFIQGLLHGFLDVLSSNDAGHPDIDQPLALYVSFCGPPPWRKPNKTPARIRKDLESLVVSRGEGERDIKSKFVEMVS